MGTADGLGWVSMSLILLIPDRVAPIAVELFSECTSIPEGDDDASFLDAFLNVGASSFYGIGVLVIRVLEDLVLDVLIKTIWIHHVRRYRVNLSSKQEVMPMERANPQEALMAYAVQRCEPEASDSVA